MNRDIQAPTPPEASAPPTVAARRRDDRGSALIISMMIMVILTMLGITFAVLATQEERISINARDHEQVLYAGESACEIVRAWFQDPAANDFKPADDEMNYSLRKGTVFKEDWKNDDERALMESSPATTDPEVDGSIGNVYIGGNLNGSGSARFDKPYRGSNGNTFWGRQQTPDVVLCGDATLDIDGFGGADCTATMKGYMDKLNRAISMTANLRTAGHNSRDFGTVEIEQIRIYRPPLDFTLLSRYGVATVEATAVKRVRNTIVARRTVRQVLQEIPFPGPSGAIETEGVISESGSGEVHWGQVVSSTSNADINLDLGGANSPEAPAARSAPTRWGYHVSINPAAYDGRGICPGCSFLTEASGSSFRFGNGAEPPAIGDPWLLFKARRSIIKNGAVGVGAQPWPWDNSGASIATNGGGNHFDKDVVTNQSHFFQRQLVRFPPIDYDTWKAIAQSGLDEMYYFQNSGGGSNYRLRGQGTPAAWTTWLNSLKTGVFFFDTVDGERPNHAGVGGVSTNLPTVHDWQSNTYVEGFIYLNAAALNSNGAGSVDPINAQMPGEPFLDDGIDLRDGSGRGDDCICVRYDKEEGCVMGVRPVRYFWNIGANNLPPYQTNCNSNDGDGCRCSGPALIAAGQGGAVGDATDQRAQREAETFRNGIWDSDIDNNGISDAGSTLSSLTNWASFVDASENDVNDGFGANGGVGWRTASTPYYTTARKMQQGAVNGTVDGDWRRDPRFLNHLGSNAANHEIGGAAVLRMVHEPFLNFAYPDAANNNIIGWAGQEANHGPKVDWRAQGDPVDADGNLTTRARDSIGGQIEIEVAINGIFYCEGVYSGSGNLSVYGSLLMRGGYTGGGSVETWFNEGIVRGDFPPKEWKLPRVYVTGHDTL